MGELTGRTALVTGASRGIGRAVALRLAAEGACVAVHYGSDEQAAAQTVERIQKEGGQAFAVQARFGEESAIDRLFWQLGAGLDGRGLDILVNNAGISSGHPIAHVTPEELRQLFEINVRKAALEALGPTLANELGRRGITVNTVAPAPSAPT